MSAESIPLLTRIWLAIVSAFAVLFDPDFALRVRALRASRPSAEPSLPPPVARTSSGPAANSDVRAPSDGALQLLALLQREGRFVDFIQQDIAHFADAEVGAAARLVHAGCAKVIADHARVSAVRSELEGARLVLPNAAPDVKLVGNVAGSAPFHGVLRHKGWRVENLELPKLVGSPDLRVVAPAELELS